MDRDACEAEDKGIQLATGVVLQGLGVSCEDVDRDVERSPRGKADAAPVCRGQHCLTNPPRARCTCSVCPPWTTMTGRADRRTQKVARGT